MAMEDTEMKVLSEIAVKVGKLEANQEATAKSMAQMAESVNRLVEKLDKSDDIAREADQRARSAHHRIDELRAEMDKRIAGIQDDIRWLWRTVLTAVIAGGIGGAAAWIWKSIGG